MRRLIRPIGWGLAIAVVILTIAALLPWLAPKIPVGFARQGVILFLKGYLAVYLVGFPVAILGSVVLIRSLLKARRRRERRPRCARWLAAFLSVAIGSVLIEGMAWSWQAWSDRTPDPVVRVGDETDSAPIANRDLYVVVIGESSAVGMPYDPAISIGQIVAWQMERVNPGRRVIVDTRAVGGFSLEKAVHTLEKPWHKPDAILLYSGHNEFHAHYELMRQVPYYADEFTLKDVATLRLRQISPLVNLIFKALDEQLVDRTPTLSGGRKLVDSPAVTPDERAHRLAVYRSGLKAFYRYCERVGALPIVFVPASNDGGFEPNRSVLRPSTTIKEREEFARAFREARAIEEADPAQGLTRYRELLKEQPEFAEAHFRLGRLLERAGDRAGANHHLALARDLDGFPLRCPGEFRDACRAEASRHDGILIDVEEVFRPLSPRGILDDHLFVDAFHPNLLGYSALARETLRRLQQRRALGWPAGVEAPSFSLAEVASSFGIDSNRWVAVALFLANWYDSVAPIRFDPADRIARKQRYTRAMQAIGAGTPAEQLDCPGLGIKSSDSN